MRGKCFHVKGGIKVGEERMGLEGFPLGGEEEVF